MGGRSTGTGNSSSSTGSSCVSSRTASTTAAAAGTHHSHTLHHTHGSKGSTAMLRHHHNAGPYPTVGPRRPCPKCGCKKRHARNCVLKNTGKDHPSTHVNFSQLDPAALKRYKRFFRLRTKSVSKSELLEVIKQHFKSMKVDESDVIESFVQMLRNAAPDSSQKSEVGSK